MKLVLSREEVFELSEVKTIIKILNKIVLKPAYLLSILFFVLGFGFFGLSFAFGKDSTIMSSGVFIIIVGIIYLIMLTVLTNKSIKKADSNLTYSYKFYDDRLVVSIITKNSNANKVVQYEELKKCVKKDNYIFLFISKNQAYILKDENLSDELYSLLKSKIKNYKE